MNPFEKIAPEELTAENDQNARAVLRSSRARTGPAAHSNSITNRYQVCGSVTEQGRAHRGANPTKRRSRAEPRSSSESEQEHHDPREVRAPTAEQNAIPFYTPSAAEHHSPTTAAGAGQSSQRLSCTGTARRSELTQSGGTETERAAHHSSGENLRPDSGRRLHFAELPAMIQRSRQQKSPAEGAGFQ